LEADSKLLRNLEEFVLNFLEKWYIIFKIMGIYIKQNLKNKIIPNKENAKKNGKN